MPTIFISYRRADSASVTGRLYDRLVERYGRTAVFKDVDSIPPGARFADYIAESIQASDVALVMIGPRWLDASAGIGRRRLDDPNDFVRLEVETALKLDVPVIPVLVDGASLPPPKRLPVNLRPLLEQNAVVLRPDPDFSHDFERLAHAVEYWQAQPRRPAPAVSTPTASAPPAPEPATSPTTQPTAGVSARPAARSVAAVAEQVSIAARQKQARRASALKFGRGAQALASMAFLVALVVALVAALHGLNPGAGGASSGAGDAAFQKTASVIDATNTALAIRGTQVFTGLGPCDTNPTEQYDRVTTHYWWSYTKDRTTCVGGNAARLTIQPGGASDVVMSFLGMPYYGDNQSFPSSFTTTMTLAFNFTNGNSTESAGYDCAAVGWDVPNETDSQWTNALYICQDGTWRLNTNNYGPNSQRHPFDISKPFTVKITVQNGSIGVTLNGVQALPMTHFAGLLDSFYIMLSSAPSHSITVSHFVFTPGAE